ncbi:transketolase [Labrys monachus]|uniref:Transketolase n=1 Tax=Labrys monachus TaxID=217067 RepID=A0ABU0F8J3_9HYPH|nr:transketolase [Labrys monachus]MDQ0390861.1 transketolase [Labrys monachus]
MALSELQNRLANAIRGLAIDGVEAAKSGHPGMPMGMADVATVLFTRFMKFDAAAPHWPDRDRFILSAGHGSMLLYSILYLTGAPGMTVDELKRFRQLGSKTPGHPENFHTAGVETTTGPLGQGIATAVGFAFAEKMLAARHGKDVVDHYTYVIASDGDLMEGISQEAIALAGHYRLNKLIVMWDHNGISIDGPLSLSDSVDQVKRFESAGWHAVNVDGHDQDAVAAAIESARKSDAPTLIACKTTIGFGSPHRAGTSKAHGEPLGQEEAALTKANLGIEGAPFEVPADILKAWREAGSRGVSARKQWEGRFGALAEDLQAEFTRRMAGERPAGLGEAILAHKKALAAAPAAMATRKSSELALNAIVGIMPELVLGSADLTPSNNTKAKGLVEISPQDFGGRYIHWGIREHGMAAAMNGISLHGGFVPAGGTFFAFTDYCRPAIRLGALMGTSPVYVMTHDSIGLGEDGPTHQPVEHLAAMRAIPNVRTFRPCDAIETAECWQLALERRSGPTILVLTRQNLPLLREATADNPCAQGAYEIAAPVGGKAEVTLFASGSEVEIAMNARAILNQRGLPTRVVSVPSLELFIGQSDEVKARIIGDAPVKVAVEAAVRFGWDAIIGPEGGFVGMSGFGASAPIKDLYNHFGITPEAVAETALRRHNG